jgi:hypothetical protein
MDITLIWGTKEENRYCFQCNLEDTIDQVKQQSERLLAVNNLVFLDINEEMHELPVIQAVVDGQLRVAFDGTVRQDILRACQSSPRRKAPPKAPSLSQKQAAADATRILGDFLYVGGQQSAGSKAFLQQANVGFVLNCCDRLPCRFPSVATYKVLQIYDTKAADVSVHFAEGIAFIEEAKQAGKACLVHCLVGASRSVSIVLAYLMAREHMSLQDAWRLVRAKRQQARPNKSFCQQLMEYECKLFGKTTATLEDFYPATRAKGQ